VSLAPTTVSVVSMRWPCCMGFSVLAGAVWRSEGVGGDGRGRGRIGTCDTLAFVDTLVCLIQGDCDEMLFTSAPTKRGVIPFEGSRSLSRPPLL